MKKWNELFKLSSMVMRAYIVGLYTTKNRKSDKCVHVSCGYIKPDYAKHCEASNYFYYLKWEKQGGPAPAQQYGWPGYGLSKNETMKHKQASCSYEWCVVNNGPKPNMTMTCTRNYFKRFSDEELANPATKPEIIAIGVDVAHHSYDSNYGLIALYDLANDRWHNDNWWSQTQAGDLMPSNHSIPAGLQPKSICGIDLVIKKMKESL